MSNALALSNALLPAAAILPGQKLVSFRLGEQLFGLALTAIRDVMPSGTVTPVPRAPTAIAGVIDIRGHIATVIDLRARFGMPGAAIDAKRYLLAAEHEGELFALLVDRIEDVVTPSPGSIAPVPVTMDAGMRDMVGGIVTHADELLLVIDLAPVIAGIEPAAH